MPKYVKTGTAFTYKVNYMVDGEPVTPSSATITVQKNDGGATSVSDEALTIVSNTTYSVFEIPSTDNDAVLPQEIRFITVEFIYNGAIYTVSDLYLLTDSILIPVTFDDVRALLSMTSEELPDSNIDLMYAYNELDSDLEGTLSSLISSGSTFLSKIQKAIAAKAAINSCQAIELMIYQSEQSDNTLYKRFSQIDFEALIARLSGIYNSAIESITETDSIIPTVFIAITGTDALTGEA